MALWPEDDTYFFCGLRLRVWSFDTLFTGDEITVGLLSFSHKAFWDDFHRRAFLHLLRKRWQEIPNEGRSLLEKRIIQGPPKRPDEAEEEYAERSSLISATILGWLINNGCDTSEKTLSILPKLRAGNPDWHSDLDKDADERYRAIRGGRITQEKDPSSLLAVPISQNYPFGARKHDKIV